MKDCCFDFFMDGMNLDLVVNNSEIQSDESLKQAVLVSLFTDARCEKSELPLGESSLRGFWGDGMFGEKTGSKLWLLNRSKYTNDTLIKAKEYAKSALDWMISDGLAKDIQIEASFNKNKNMILNISIFKNNEEIESMTVRHLWGDL